MKRKYIIVVIRDEDTPFSELTTASTETTEFDKMLIDLGTQMLKGGEQVHFIVQDEYEELYKYEVMKRRCRNPKETTILIQPLDTRSQDMLLGISVYN
jgi:hypothetical protein